MDPTAFDDRADVQLARYELALRCQKIEVVATKILTLLLHDERFSGWTPRDKVNRRHFSTEYLRLYRRAGSEALLYTYHEQLKAKQIFSLNDAGTVKIFPVKLRFPPFLRFGNDHNPLCILEEMIKDIPDLVHFHNYYLFSFPYVARFVKKKLERPLIAQLHGYENHWARKWLYLPCLLALKHADRIIYSYEPEKTTYNKLGLMEKTVKLPVPGIDPEAFKPQTRPNTTRLLYVGRIPAPEAAYAEKSPIMLVQILKKLLRRSNGYFLDVVGDGPGLPHICRFARSLGVADHIVFHGFVSYDDLPVFYQRSMLTFSPIRVYDVDGWFDGSIQESLACGTPVAAFKESPSTPLRGTYGFLLSNNIEKASLELHQLLRTPDDMNEVAMEGSAFVRNNCSCDRVALDLEKNLKSVIQN